MYISAPRLEKFKGSKADFRHEGNAQLCWNSEVRIALASSSEERPPPHRGSLFSGTPFVVPQSAEGGHKQRRRNRHPVTNSNRLFAKNHFSRDYLETREGRPETNPVTAFAERVAFAVKEVQTRGEQRTRPLCHAKISRNRSPLKTSHLEARRDQQLAGQLVYAKNGSDSVDAAKY